MVTRNFRQLIDAMPAARRQKLDQRFQASLAAMPLEELRRTKELTQLQLGELLGVHQSEVSKIEHRSDLCVSTLADYVEALGGRLELRAVFPDRAVVINQFDDARE